LHIAGIFPSANIPKKYQPKSSAGSGVEVMSDARQVGVIGLGAMGTGIAHTLARKGYAVLAYDTRLGVAASFAAGHPGAVACASPAEVAQQCKVVVSVVVNAAQNEQVLFGDKGCADSLRKGAVYVMCSTVDPNWAVGMEARLQALDLHFIDAPISGGAAKAAAGEMTVMSSATPQAYAASGTVLDDMAGKVYRMGDRAGQGSAVKIINQLLAGVHIAAAAEAMALGMKQGIAPVALYEVITHSAGNSWMFENRMQHVLSGTLSGTPQAGGAPRINSAVDIFVKDLGLVHDTAQAAGFPTPLAAAALQQFKLASLAGHGREEDAAVIKVFPNVPK
jgi:L-threonate 2-dehydrogenase